MADDKTPAQGTDDPPAITTSKYAIQVMVPGQDGETLIVNPELERLKRRGSHDVS